MDYLTYALIQNDVMNMTIIHLYVTEMGEGRLVTTLTSVDRANVRPTMDYTKPTNVIFQFTLFHIKELVSTYVITHSDD